MYELLNSIDCVTMIDKKIKHNKNSNKKKNKNTATPKVVVNPMIL